MYISKSSRELLSFDESFLQRSGKDKLIDRLPAVHAAQDESETLTMY